MGIHVGPFSSMDRFRRERATLSCPGGRVGQLEDLFGRSASTLSSVPEPNVNKPAVISSMDSLADLPTMPCTPEPFNTCWQPFVHDVPAPADLPTMPCTPEPLNMFWHPFVHDVPARQHVADALFISRQPSTMSSA